MRLSFNQRVLIGSLLAIFASNSNSFPIINDITTTSRTNCLAAGKNDQNDNPLSEKVEMKTYNPLRLLVLKLGFTEPMWLSPLNYEKNEGEYSCAFCGNILFDSTSKYDSGSGWPSFWRSTSDGAIAYKRELDGRLECLCGKCNSHLGHVFPDGPKFGEVDPDVLGGMPPSDPKTETRLPRFCMNGASLRFEKRN